MAHAEHALGANSTSNYMLQKSQDEAECDAKTMLMKIFTSMFSLLWELD